MTLYSGIEFILSLGPGGLRRMEENGTRIGAVASQAGVNVQTLRYYERRGLLPRPERTASGYRHYAPETVGLVRFIKRAQELGFTLSEIGQLLAFRDPRHRDSARVLKLASAKIADIDGKIARLRAIRGALAALAESCECGKSTLECAILESLNRDG